MLTTTRFPMASPFLPLFMLASFGANATAAQTIADVAAKVRPAVVTVLTYDADGSLLATGSGFFASPSGELVSNRHVFAGAVTAEVRDTAGLRYPVVGVVAEDSLHDLLKVTVNTFGGSMPSLDLAEDEPAVGQPVVVLGSPRGLEGTVSNGIVSAVRNVPEYGPIIQITAPVSPGSSGGPVVDMDGNVIGVATAQLPNGQNLNFAVPAEFVARLASGRVVPLHQWNRPAIASRPAAPRVAIPVSSRLRVFAPAQGLQGADVSFRGFVGDTMVVRRNSSGLQLLVPLALVDSIDAWVGVKQHTGQGALIGLLAGAAVGMLIGSTVEPYCAFTDAQGNESNCASRSETVISGGLVGGLIGPLIGTPIGAAVRTTVWERVPLDRLRRQ